MNPMVQFSPKGQIYEVVSKKTASDFGTTIGKKLEVSAGDGRYKLYTKENIDPKKASKFAAAILTICAICTAGLLFFIATPTYITDMWKGRSVRHFAVFKPNEALKPDPKIQVQLDDANKKVEKANKDAKTAVEEKEKNKNEYEAKLKTLNAEKEKAESDLKAAKAEKKDNIKLVRENEKIKNDFEAKLKTLNDEKVKVEAALKAEIAAKAEKVANKEPKHEKVMARDELEEAIRAQAANKEFCLALKIHANSQLKVFASNNADKLSETDQTMKKFWTEIATIGEQIEKKEGYYKSFKEETKKHLNAIETLLAFMGGKQDFKSSIEVFQKFITPLEKLISKINESSPETITQVFSTEEFKEYIENIRELKKGITDFYKTASKYATTEEYLKLGSNCTPRNLLNYFDTNKTRLENLSDYFPENHPFKPSIEGALIIMNGFDEQLKSDERARNISRATDEFLETESKYYSDLENFVEKMKTGKTSDDKAFSEIFAELIPLYEGIISPSSDILQLVKTISADNIDEIGNVYRSPEFAKYADALILGSKTQEQYNKLFASNIEQPAVARGSYNEDELFIRNHGPAVIFQRLARHELHLNTLKGIAKKDSHLASELTLLVDHVRISNKKCNTLLSEKDKPKPSTKPKDEDPTLMQRGKNLMGNVTLLMSDVTGYMPNIPDVFHRKTPTVEVKA